MGTLRKGLASGRPPTARHPRSISRKSTKKLINNYHLLQKRKEQALANGHADEAAVVEAQLTALGGIQRYQQASLQGQKSDRGGDTSKVLMDWLAPVFSSAPGLDSESLRMLEVGALSTQNACSLSGYFDIERIDLNSQAPGILKQDFLQRPLPAHDSDLFHVISLSLVLNFVSTPQERGEMLRRTTRFLHISPHTNSGLKSVIPGLFLVLPAPCVSNSRYLDAPRLDAMMSSLGYMLVKTKVTSKLFYSLWRRESTPPTRPVSFTKKEIRAGKSRNNFAIVLDHGPART